MAKNKREPAGNAQPPRKMGLFGLLFLPLRVVFHLAWYLGASILLSLLLEWGGMLLGIVDYYHAGRVMQAELGYLGNSITHTLLGMSAEATGIKIVAFFNSGLVDVQTVPVAENRMIFLRMIDDLFANWPHYRNAFFYVLMITAIRCAIIVLSSVLLVLVGMVAAIDGLHLRELRKVTGGVEHAGIYHHAKALLPYTVWFGPVAYLAWPNAVNPNFVLLPGMAMFFIATLTLFATYKKIL